MGVFHQYVCRTVKYISNFSLLFFFIISLSAQNRSYPVQIDTFRDNGRLVILSSQRLEEGEYAVVFRSLQSGSITVVSSERIQRFDEYRYSAIAETDNLRKKPAMVSGSILVLNREIQQGLPSYSDSFGNDYQEYQNRIRTEADGREMVLVEGGITLIGSDVGDEDEKPVHTRIVDTFYIDRYEVSNRDYLKFIMKTGQKAPLSWVNGEFPQEKADHPVIATYYEALSYAKWSGKRLPTEFEWERAANGVVASKKTVTEDGLIDNPYKTRYPWGNNISNETHYSVILHDNSGENQYTDDRVDATVTIYRYEQTDVSYYGAVQMGGNAPEWTSSWYTAYKGNRKENIRYGTQVKVIRGGAWYSPPEQCTVSSRAYGGLPSLEKDSAAGFRCVREVDSNDLMGDE